MEILVKLTKVVVVILVLLLLLIVSFLIIVNKEHTFMTSISPNNKYKIIATYKDPWLFGPCDVTIYYKGKYDLFKHKAIETEIANDGGTPRKGDCTVKWGKNCVLINIQGEEMDSEQYRIDFGKKIKTEEIDPVVK